MAIVLSKWQFGGQGLNFNAPREDPTPLSGVRETQWVGVLGQRGRKRQNFNSVGSNPTEFQLHHLRPQWPCTPPHCVPPHCSHLRQGDNATKVTERPFKSWNTAVCPQNAAEGPKSESIREPPESGESIQKRAESVLETSKTCAAGLFGAGTALCAPWHGGVGENTLRILSEYSQNTLRF